MSATVPFLPVPDPRAQSDAEVLPADDRAELARSEGGWVTEGNDAETDEVARPALFRTPAPGDALDGAELRADLGLD